MTKKRSQVTHSLTNIDPAEMAGDCSVCGPKVPVQKVSARRADYACRTARREARRNYRQAHPYRVAEEKSRHRHGSPHRLAPDGLCAICGPVKAVVHGRGVMCGNRAEELGWKSQPAVQGRCDTCRNWLRGNECPECDSREGYDLGYGLMMDEYARKHQSPEWWEGACLTIEDARLVRDVLHGDIENAVPGWKTLGAHE